MTDSHNQAPEDLGAPVAHLVLAAGTQVYDRAGDAVGTVEHVLADDKGQIFHGLILKTGAGHRYAGSDQVDGIFEHGVIVAAPAGELPEPSANAAAQAAGNDDLRTGLKRAWEWLIQPK